MKPFKQYILENDNDQTVVGYIEKITFPEFDDLELSCKIDSGNTDINVLGVTEFKVKDDKVTFTIQGKEYTKELEKVIKNIVSGVLTQSVDERPSILTNIIFNDKEYKDVLFVLDKRNLKRKDSEVLLSRNVMTRLNILIDPLKQFVLGKL